MKRREFMRQVLFAGGAVVLAPLIKACTPAGEAVSNSAASLPAKPAPTAVPSTPGAISAVATPASTSEPPAPTSTAAAVEPTAVQPSPTITVVEPPTAAVALVRTSDRADGVRRALDLLDHNPVHGRRVLLKPNYNSADPAPGSTHLDTLRALTGRLQEMGAAAITLGERSGMGETRQVLAQTGVLALAEEMGLEITVFDELAEEAWALQRPSGSHWRDGFPLPRMLLDAECVVQTCNLKTHRYGGHFTMALKNSVGFVARTTHPGGYNYMQELHNSDYQRQMIAEVNAAYTPSLILLDGVEAFVDGGPATGTKAHPHVLLAGRDPVAIDAAGVAILRQLGTTPQVSEGRVFDLAQIKRAVELGLGIDAPQRIRFLTDDDAGAAYAHQISALLA